jgi:hypothetical protein
LDKAALTLWDGFSASAVQPPGTPYVISSVANPVNSVTVYTGTFTGLAPVSAALIGNSAIIGGCVSGTITSVDNASGGFTTYHGTFSGSNANYVFQSATVTGVAGNAGTFPIHSSTGTTLVLVNPNGVADASGGSAFIPVDDINNGSFVITGVTPTTLSVLNVNGSAQSGLGASATVSVQNTTLEVETSATNFVNPIATATIPAAQYQLS